MCVYSFYYYFPLRITVLNERVERYIFWSLIGFGYSWILEPNYCLIPFHHKFIKYTIQLPHFIDEVTLFCQWSYIGQLWIHLLSVHYTWYPWIHPSSYTVIFLPYSWGGKGKDGGGKGSGQQENASAWEERDFFEKKKFNQIHVLCSKESGRFTRKSVKFKFQVLYFEKPLTGRGLFSSENTGSSSKATLIPRGSSPATPWRWSWYI